MGGGFDTSQRVVIEERPTRRGILFPLSETWLEVTQWKHSFNPPCSDANCGDAVQTLIGSNPTQST